MVMLQCMQATCAWGAICLLILAMSKPALEALWSYLLVVA
jgi:hypothetical protein